MYTIHYARLSLREYKHRNRLWLVGYLVLSFMFLFCLMFAMSLCASVYMCFVVDCWERADLLALFCGVLL